MTLNSTLFLGKFGTRLLYRCTFNVDLVGTTDDELYRLIEDALKDEAESWEWPPYEWLTHKIVSDYARPDYNYYLVEVGEIE